MEACVLCDLTTSSTSSVALFSWFSLFLCCLQHVSVRLWLLGIYLLLLHPIPRSLFYVRPLFLIMSLLATSLRFLSTRPLRVPFPRRRLQYIQILFRWFLLCFLIPSLLVARYVFSSLSVSLSLWASCLSFVLGLPLRYFVASFSSSSMCRHCVSTFCTFSTCPLVDGKPGASTVQVERVWEDPTPATSRKTDLVPFRCVSHISATPTTVAIEDAPSCCRAPTERAMSLLFERSVGVQ